MPARPRERPRARGCALSLGKHVRPLLPARAHRRAAAPVAALAALLVALTGLGALPASAQGSTEQARVADTRAELQAVRDELDAARSTAEGDRVALEDADRQLEAAFAAVDSARQAVERQQQAVEDASARLADAREDLAAQRALMAERVGRLYRQARPDDVVAFLGTTSVTEAVQQGAYMRAIGREDRVLVETLGNSEARVEAEERALGQEQEAMAAVLEEQQALLAEVEEIRQDRALVAAASEDLVARLQAREEHLEEQAAELERLARERAAAAAAAAAAAEAAARAAAAGSAGSGGGGGAAQGEGAEEGGADEDAEAGGGGAPAAPPPPSGGGFSWPTSGSITSGFGARWGRMHEGIDIANGTGTPVAAARGGSVIQAGSMSGYGNVVMIAHSGGFVTVYAHLSSIAVSNGQSVSTGTFLGGMGCTGSCTGTHLHFEIRAGGTPVDPMAYL
jgi:septal ring factor EnvC (AmiA/AmiB activator)